MARLVYSGPAPMAYREGKKPCFFLRTHTDDGGDVSCEVKLLGSVVGSGIALRTLMFSKLSSGQDWRFTDYGAYCSVSANSLNKPPT